VSNPIVIVSELRKQGQYGRSIYVPEFPEAEEGFYLVVGPFASEGAAAEAGQKVTSAFGLDVMALRFGTSDPYGPRA
jgi:hypothetical protein